MANWRPVDVRVWNDRKFLAGGDDARMLWLFLLTCPSLPIPGVVVGGDAALAEQLGWATERLREGFHELQRNGLQVRRESRIVWLPNALKYQPCAGPNAIKCWGKKWDDVPEGELKLELWEALRIACKSWSVLFSKLFPKPFSEGSANPSRNPSSMGSTHDHKHDHYHQHDHDQEDLPPARAIPRTTAYPTRNGMGPAGEPARIEPPPERPDSEAKADIHPDARAAAITAGEARTEARMLLDELEHARAEAAEALSVDVQPLTIGDTGEHDLLEMLAAARKRGPVELDKLVRQARHAIAMAKLETTSGEKSIEWFTGVVFRPNNFRRLCSKTAKPTVRAGPQSRDPTVGRIASHQPEDYEQGDVEL